MTVRGVSQPFQIGTVGTTLSFLLDLLGSGAGAVLAHLLLISRFPFCSQCKRYKKRQRYYRILLAVDQSEVKTLLLSIARFCALQDYPGLSQSLLQLQSDHHSADASIMVTADDRICPGCRETTVLGKVYRKTEKGEWDEIPQLAFSLTSGPAAQTK